MLVSGRTHPYQDIQGDFFDPSKGSSHLSDLPAEYLKNDTDTSKAFSFFGDPNWAKGTAENFRAGGLALANHQAPDAQMNMDNVRARRGQMDALDAYKAQIQGTGPSMAPILQRRGMDAAAARGNMATVGGPVGLAGNQRMAMLGAGAGANMAATNAAATRAGEVSNAYQGFMGGSNQMIGDDIGAASRQAGLNMQNRQFGDRLRSQYEDLALGVEETQMRGQHARLAGLVNARDNYNKAYQERTAADAAQREKEANMLLGYSGGLISAGGSLIPRGGK